MAYNYDNPQPATLRKWFKIADRWMENGFNGVEAYQSQYPNANAGTAKREFNKMKKLCPQIRDYITETQTAHYESLNITIERVYEEMSKMAFNNDPEYPQAVKAKVLDSLMKNLKDDAKIDGSLSSAHIVIDISGGAEDEDNSEEEDI